MEFDFDLASVLMSSKGVKPMPQPGQSNMDTPEAGSPRSGPGEPLKVEGLLGRMAPSCRGPLKRRTRFTRGWRTESDTFEIRSTMLVLYKQRKGGSSIGFLDAIFSRATFADLDLNHNNNAGSNSHTGSTHNLVDSQSSSAADLNSGSSQGLDLTGGNGSHSGNWNCVFDLTGATAVALPADDKARTYPFKVTFAAGGGPVGEGSDRSLNLCAETEQQRATWLASIEVAAKGVQRDNFHLLKTVGRGQWGKVFLVKKTTGIVATRLPTATPYPHGEDGGRVEILALKEVALSSKTNISHVQNERLIMEAVPPHEFIVNMQYAFRSGRFLYYALDFMNGGDLFRHWRRHRDRRNEMAPFYAAEVLLALEHLHAHNVIYRDLKPENVLLDDIGHVKLADLGLAKMLKDESARTTSFCGTEAYLAPEMILRVPYAYSVDYWQYGCFVFELYAGRSPFWLPRKPRKFIRDNILNGSFAYPTAVPEMVKPLINALLCVNENSRLGTSPESSAWDSVRADPFFAGVDWRALANKKLTPPVLPEDPGPDQCNNFDEDFTSQLPTWGEHPDGPGNDAVNAFEEELLGFNFVRLANASSAN